jgi:hypothetical protein
MRHLFNIVMSGRGRGKRAASKIDTTVAATVEGANEEKMPKKSGRKKQFPVVAVITPDGIEGNLLPETRKPLIVHLPIQSKDIPENDSLIKYDPNPPIDAQPYDMNADNPFYDDVEHLPDMNLNGVNESTMHDSFASPISTNTNTNQPSLMEPKQAVTQEVNQELVTDFYNIKSTLLIQYKESAEIKNIPETSDAACFWCCHTFSNRPVVLPIRDTGEHLIVHGNFCCPECACAYLFDIRQDAHTRWEQLALLYRVYGDACQGKIHPSPAKQVLRLFGGNLTILEYRNLIQSHKVRIDIHLPPMVSILSTMDTKPIDFYDTSLTKVVSETVKERLQKAEEVLRLRRTKPLKAWESTLDACLNLKIRHDRS